MDAETLARITPGISQLQATGPDQFKAIANVKIGPVSGSFTGQVEIRDKAEPHSFVLRVEQNSKIGNVAADVHIQLTEKEPGTTEMSFTSDAQLSGLLARTGQRVLSGVANTLSSQFFKALEEELG